jgi:hypothetical protein
VSVTVRLVGDLHKYSDAEVVEIVGTGWTLGTALDEVVRQNPRLSGELFDDAGRLRYTTLLVLNGRSAAWPQDRGMSIEDGTEVVLTRFYSGG